MFLVTVSLEELSFVDRALALVKYGQETFTTWQGHAARFPDALKSNCLQPQPLPTTKFAVNTGCTGNRKPLDAALQMTVPQRETQTSAHQIKRRLAQYPTRRKETRK
ncbi:unnamed protein product [Sphagnum troendelagicum]|uniref:Uncharacterized protein n=1 Tax=Sphagnum troendelagicum TaxID=128251 RepID=A0ABP0UQJ9_9BRYO